MPKRPPSLRVRGRTKSPSGNCVKCNIWRQFLQRDHIIPLWKDGLDTPKNIQLLCANCHEDKTRAEGSWGRKHTAEARRIMTERRHSEITKRLMSETRKNLPPPVNAWLSNVGRKFGAEFSANITAGRAREKERRINEMYEKPSLFDDEEIA